MKCRKAERFLLRSFDGPLGSQETQELERHIENCPKCRQRADEYQEMLEILRTTNFPEPKPYFWERLRPQLKERPLFNPWPVWKQWGIRAIPLSILLLVLFAAALIFVGPQRPVELSPSEAFLLQNRNPLQEASNLLDQEKTEDKNMMLIFASLDEEMSKARYIP